jgi:hypothetical protein
VVFEDCFSGFSDIRYLQGRAPLACDPSDNKPVVAYSDWDNSKKARAMKWSSGTTWTDLGYPAETLPAMLNSIALDPADNKPVVAFAHSMGAKRIQVFRWLSGNDWADLRRPGTGESGHPSIAISSDRNLFIIFTDGTNGWRAHVMKKVLQ